MKNDMQIQQDVVAQLDHAQNVITGTIGVEVHHGVVKLAGRVGDSSIKKDAELAASGLSNPEIAQRLFVTRKTVETHLGHVYLKLDISSRHDLAATLQSPAE